jgi:hypothetical protein
VRSPAAPLTLLRRPDRRARRPRTSAIIYGVTAFRNVAGAVLAAGVVALAGLTGCSSGSAGGGGATSTPTLYDKYSKTLTDQQNAIHTDCMQITPACVSDLDQLMSTMNSIRADAAKASASGKFTKLLAALDQVDKDRKLFSDNCGTGNVNYNCSVLAASTIVRDSVNVNNNLASTD